MELSIPRKMVSEEKAIVFVKCEVCGASSKVESYWVGDEEALRDAIISVKKAWLRRWDKCSAPNVP
jgi:hypothetical protein